MPHLGFFRPNKTVKGFKINNFEFCTVKQNRDYPKKNQYYTKGFRSQSFRFYMVESIFFLLLRVYYITEGM